MKNNSFSIYRAIAILLSKGIHFSDMLTRIGISRIFVYGMGEMGCLLCDDLENYAGVEISGKLDKKFGCCYENVKNSDAPIVITPIGYFEEIEQQLASEGVAVDRLISIAQVIILYEHFTRYEKAQFSFGKNKEFMIVGANFDNKGSQAMAFVAISELRKKFDNPLIWFLPNFWDDIYKNEDYRMITLEDGFGKGSLFSEILPRISAVVDVSGYAISSKKGFGTTERIMDIVSMAYDNNVPYYMMPQSFGPLDYPKYKLEEMKELLSFVRVIYAREEVGKTLLEKLGLKNVRLSSDMVLASGNISRNDIYRRYDEKNGRKIDCPSSGVAIVPNTNVELYISIENLLLFYRSIINHLLSTGKEIHIIPHSGDYEICRKIYGLFEWNKKVFIWGNEGDCFDFSDMISELDYIIASRYHAVVHAYKKGIPCIVVGWADKYKELVESLGQSRYLLDVRNGLESDLCISMISEMEMRRDENQGIIQERIKTIDRTNPFDVFDKLS